MTARPVFQSDTLDGLFAEVAAAHPEVVAYVEGDDRLTYRQWTARADALAAELTARGVGERDVVAIMLPSSIDFAVAYATASRLGAIATGINTRLGSTEITAILERCRPAVLFHEGHGDGVPPGAPRPKVVMARDELRALAARDVVREVTPSPRPDEPACIVWTSGTTGTPKGAWFDHRALRASAEMSGILSSPFDVRSMPLPFAHAGYMNKMWDQLAHVITSVLLPGAWTPESMLDVMVRERVTVGQGVPTQWSKMLELPKLADADLSSLRLASTGSAPVSPELAERMRTGLGCPIVVRYACTESSTMTGTAPDDPPEVLLNTVGRPLPGVEMVLVDEDLAEVGDGATGIIRMRTPCQMRGYWDDEERTAEVMSPDGWILTGDLGRFRPDGNLVLCGRRTEMYIRGGYNVYPLEVENVLSEHPAIERVAVLGAGAPTIGEIGVAFVVPADPGAPPDRDELRAWCRGRLADYKAPDRVEIVDELPLTSMMKIDKAALRARLD
jgi:acyl-CoA synthetase (AMP-forming)/AMP-acid ligase II